MKLMQKYHTAYSNVVHQQLHQNVTVIVIVVRKESIHVSGRMQIAEEIAKNETENITNYCNKMLK